MPPWLLIVILGSLFAALGYQILRGRPLRRVPMYWVIILALVLLAEVLAESSGLTLPQLGELQILPDIAAVGVAIGMLFLLRL